MADTAAVVEALVAGPSSVDVHKHDPVAVEDTAVEAAVVQDREAAFGSDSIHWFGEDRSPLVAVLLVAAWVLLKTTSANS